MLLTLTSYLACFIIPLFVGALALAPFRYDLRFGIFIHWLIFSLIVIYVVRRYGTFGLLGGIAGVMVGMYMVIPALVMNAWGTASLLASLNIKEDLSYFYSCICMYPTFFVMGYSSLMLGGYGATHYRLFLDEPGRDNWRFFVYACLLTVSPAMVAGLKRLFQSKDNLPSR